MSTKNKFGYFEIDGKKLGPDDPIILCYFHRRDIGATIVQDVTYVDSKGVSWYAEKNDEFNGASIPRFWRRLWTPYSPRLRDASLFHDIYCTLRCRPQKQTHYMYWEALRCLGVWETTADIQWFCIVWWCYFRYWNWK